MAVSQKLRGMFDVPDSDDTPAVRPAPETRYFIKPLTKENLPELMRLSVRCFRGSETYNRETFDYLLSDPSVISYQMIAAKGEITAFVFIIDNKSLIAHITTIAVAPEHRKRGLARTLLAHAEKSLTAKGFESLMLEVRVSNTAAQNLYHDAGYVTIQKLNNYYLDGEDAFMMSKSLMR